MRFKTRYLCLLVLVCAGVTPAADAGQDCTLTQREELHVIANNRFRINSWRDGAYRVSGSVCRGWANNGDWLWLTFNKQTGGGFDTGISRNGVTAKTVNAIYQNNRQQKVGARWTQIRMGSTRVQDGIWWYGPKVIITPQRNFVSLTQNGSYECYIVDRSNLSREGLRRRFGLMPKGEGTYNGSRYTIYTDRVNGIDQIWMIRHNYRSAGEVSVAYVLKQWRDMNLINGNSYVHDWRVNVETQGKVEGTFGMAALTLPLN